MDSVLGNLSPLKIQGLPGMPRLEPEPSKSVNTEAAEKAVTNVNPEVADNPEVQAKVRELQSLIDKLKQADKSK